MRRMDLPMFGKFGAFLPNIGKNGKSVTFHSSLFTFHFLAALASHPHFLLLPFFFLLPLSGILSEKLRISVPLCEISLRSLCSLWLSNPFSMPAKRLSMVFNVPKSLRLFLSAGNSSLIEKHGAPSRIRTLCFFLLCFLLPENPGGRGRPPFRMRHWRKRPNPRPRRRGP